MNLYGCLSPELKYGYEKLYFWLPGIASSILGIVGLVCNVINLIVLCQPELRQKTFYKLLAVLALFDTIFIISYGIKNGYMSLACQPLDENISHLMYPVFMIGITGSAYMTVAISLERYLGLCHPQFYKRPQTCKSARNNG